jgi:hypothetical protein
MSPHCYAVSGTLHALVLQPASKVEAVSSCYLAVAVRSVQLLPGTTLRGTAAATAAPCNQRMSVEAEHDGNFASDNVQVSCWLLRWQMVCVNRQQQKTSTAEDC